MADRAEYILKTIEVKHVAKPYGPNRDNPPDLWDLRKFVEACEGLPDTLPVSISTGGADTTGRKDVTFSVIQKEPVTDQMVEERARSRGWFKRE